MLNVAALDHAISIHTRSYQLLKWLEKAVIEGFVPPAHAHDLTTAGDAAAQWIKRHYHNIPPDCRPEPGEILEFGRFFGTYLETSFDLLSTPERTYFTTCGCTCPLCLKLSNPRQLKPKSLTKQDKLRAGKLRANRLEVLACSENLIVPTAVITTLATNEKSMRDVSFSAYGASLLERLNGISPGPAILALWRNIAWNPNGSPIRHFKLCATDIINSEHSLMTSLRAHSI